MPLQPNGRVVIDQNDIGKSDFDILMDMIYETNKVRFPREHIWTGTPSALDQRPDIDDDENTYIDVRINPNWDNEYSRHSGFLYRRHDLTQYFENIDISITATEFPFTVRSIWDTQVQPFLPYPINKNDIQDYLFTSLTSDTITVYATSGSLLWTGKVHLHLNPISPAFFELCPVTPFLAGFTEFVPGV
jgi:hypothetical protein